MKLTAPVIGIGIVVVAGLAYFVVTRKETKDALIHFSMVERTCKAKLEPDNRLVVIKKKQKVKFTVQDDCDVTKGYTLDTELVNWKSTSDKCDDATEFPFDGSAKGKKTFTRGIKDKCKEKLVFTFEIAVDGNVIADPELEIALISAPAAARDLLAQR